MTRQPWTEKDGKELRSARRTFGLSQAQLGLAVGVTSSRICEIERVNFPGGRYCSPGKELGTKLGGEFAKQAKRAEKSVAKKTAKKVAKEKVEVKAEAKVAVEEQVETKAETVTA